MNYLIYGQENYLVINKYKELIKGYEELSIYQNDYTNKEFSIEDFINNINTIDLFSNKKMYILSNCNFLKAKDKFTDDNYKLLEEYLNNSNDENDVIFMLNLKVDEKVDSRKKIFKLLNKTCKVFNYEQIDAVSFKSYFSDFINKYSLDINKDAKEEFFNRLPLDLLNMENEFLKLSLLSNTITKQDICELISPIYNEKIFDLIDALIIKNTNKGLEIFYDLLNQDNEPLAMVYQLAAQFRFIFKVKTLLNRGFDSNNIISELKQNPYYIKNTINKCSKIGTQRILKILSELSELDIKFKSDINIDKRIMLEMFIFKELS